LEQIDEFLRLVIKRFKKAEIVLDKTDLMRSAKKGDVKSFQVLIEPEIDKLYGLAYQMIGQEDDASDAVQETMIKAFRFIGQYREESSFSTWLIRILRNTILDTFKKASNRYEETVDQFTEQQQYSDLVRSSDDNSLLNAMLDEELRVLLLNHITQLSDKLQAPLILYDLQGFSYDEIAEILEINLGTVKSRLNRARVALRESILKEPESLASYLPQNISSTSKGGDNG
jgi:RNA polymerase sigma-70 factor, ECF subfamily